MTAKTPKNTSKIAKHAPFCIQSGKFFICHNFLHGAHDKYQVSGMSFAKTYQQSGMFAVRILAITLFAQR